MTKKETPAERAARLAAKARKLTARDHRRLVRHLNSWIRDLAAWTAAGLPAREPLTVAEAKRRLGILKQVRRLVDR